MSESGFQVTFEEIQRYDWQAIGAKRGDDSLSGVSRKGLSGRSIAAKRNIPASLA
jgi:hypothetical protein